MKGRTRGVLVVLLAAAFALGGCKGPAPAGKTETTAPESGQEIVAVVGDVSISAGELDAAAKGQLQKLMAQVYQVRRNVLDGMIADKLIEKAAEAEGTSKEAYLAENVDAKIDPPTNEEVEAFYEQQKGRVKAPLDEMRERITDYLKSTRQQAKRQELVASLKEKAGVKVMLEPPRTEITLDGAAFTSGVEDARIVLVEFSDYECPFSKRAQETVHRVLDEYRGKIHYAFFDFPLSFHATSRKAHEAARCAGEQGKYAEYGKKLFENQTQHGVDELKKYAADIGLDTEAFNSCLDGGKTSAPVQASLEQGGHAGVGGTPAFFVNGIMISGAQPFESFKEVVEAELTR